MLQISLQRFEFEENMRTAAEVYGRVLDQVFYMLITKV